MAQFRIKISCSFRKWSWWDEFWWQSPTFGLTACRADTSILVGALRGALSGSVQIESAVITAATADLSTFYSGVSEVDYSLGRSGSPALGDCAPPWLALYMRFYDSSSLYARNWLIRGIDAGALCSTKYPYSVPYYVSGDLTLRLLDVMQVLTQQKAPCLQGASLSTIGSQPQLPAASNVTQGRFCFRVRDKTVGRQASLPLLGVGETGPGLEDLASRWLIKVGDSQVLNLNDRIHIHGVTGQGITTINGDAVVTGPKITVGLNAGYYPLNRADNELECKTVWFGTGRWWRLKDILVPFFRCETGRVTKKKTGMVHYGTAGKGKPGQPCANKQR